MELGSFVFILLISNTNKCSNLKMAHYADESTANDFETDISVYTHKINFELQKVDEWLRTKKIVSKYFKSAFSIFLNMNNDFIPNISIRGQNRPMICHT